MQSREYKTLSGKTITIENVKDGACRHDSIKTIPVFERAAIYKYQCCECFSKFTEEEFQSIINH